MEPNNTISVETANKMLRLITPIVLDLKEKWTTVDKNLGTGDYTMLQKSIKTICRRLDEIEELGCFLEDIDRGIIDFPSKVDGERVMLCWMLGEEEVLHNHRRGENIRHRLLIKQVVE